MPTRPSLSHGPTATNLFVNQSGSAVATNVVVNAPADAWRSYCPAFEANIQLPTEARPFASVTFVPPVTKAPGPSNCTVTFGTPLPYLSRTVIVGGTTN